MSDSDYKAVFDAVNGKIDIDLRFSVEDYLKLLNEIKIYNAEIINMCGGILKIQEFPVLELEEERFRGDYIDFLTPADLDAPIMRGIDPFGRPFITFRYKIRSARQDSADMMEVETAFQRYSLDKKLWTTGGSGLNQISLGYSKISFAHGSPENTLISEHLLRLIKKENVGYSYSIALPTIERDKVDGKGRSVVLLT